MISRLLYPKFLSAAMASSPSAETYFVLIKKGSAAYTCFNIFSDISKTGMPFFTATFLSSVIINRKGGGARPLKVSPPAGGDGPRALCPGQKNNLGPPAEPQAQPAGQTQTAPMA